MSYGDYTLKTDNYYEQDLIDTSANQNGQWYDPVFIVSKKSVEVGKYFKIGPSGALVLPLKESSRNDTGMLYTVSAAANVSVNTKNLNMDAWSFGYQLNAYRYFTQFDTKAGTGDPNMHHRFRNRFTFGYKFTDKFSFSNLVIC